MRCPMCEKPIAEQGGEQPDTCPACGEAIQPEANAGENAGEPPVSKTSVSRGPIQPDSSFPVIPNHHVTSLLDSGGMALVYKAEQVNPERTVAAKIFPSGRMANTDLRERFDREASVVAKLDHPHLVPIYDKGVTEKGEPYYTMPLIDGVKLDEYVQNNNLNFHATLALFTDVCEAVQAAHQKGVIHRDLKPSNVIVDKQGEPHILDFGLAKLIREEDSPDVPVTISSDGAMLGTPAYMTPEQTEGKPEFIDTRTDVYALGVILYYLVTNTFPYEVNDNYVDVGQRIRNEPPVRPSRRVSSSPEDLDAVLLKALAKEKAERYQTAALFAEDLRRVRHKEPINARSPAILYRMKKWVERNKGLAAVSAVSAVLIVGVLIVSFIHINAARKRAETALVRAKKQKEQAVRNLEVALLNEKLVPFNQAELTGHFQNLQLLQNFEKADKGRVRADEKAISPTVLKRKEITWLHEKLNALIRTREIGPLARAGASVDEFESLIQTVNRRGQNNGNSGSLRERIIELLEQNVYLPPVRNRIRQQNQIRHTLRKLDADNKQLNHFEQWRKNYVNDMDLVYEEDFNEFERGTKVNDWRQEYDVEKRVVAGPHKALLVGSTFGNAGHVEHTLPEKKLNASQCVRLTCSVSFQSTAQEVGEQFCAAVGFLPVEGRKFGLLVKKGRFAAKKNDQIVKTRPCSKQEQYQVRVQYFPHRGTYDVWINDSLFFEEMSMPRSAEGLKGITAKSRRGVNVFVDDIKVRVTDKKAKQRLGEYKPFVEKDKLNLSSTRYLDLPPGDIEIHDVNQDGQNEMVFAEENNKGQFRFLRIQDTANGCGIRKERLKKQHLKTAEPADLGGGFRDFLVVTTTKNRPQKDGNGKIRILKMRILHVHDNFMCHPVYAKCYKRGSVVRISSISYGKNREGFAAGFDHYVRGLDFFKYTPKAEKLFQSLGFYRPCDKHASDVLSVATYDRDQNGQDELFVGWGPWDYYAPGVVTLQGGEPIKHKLITSQSVGKTRVATSPLNGENQYLIAVSQKSHLSNGEPIDGYGMRVWHLAGEEMEEVCHRQANYTDIAAGRINDQNVFVVERREMKEGKRTERLHLEIFTLTSDEKLKRLWHATFDKRKEEKKKPQAFLLQLTDVNNDGRQELLCRINDRGILVFQSDKY